MQRKIIFLDIDGTLLNHHFMIPQSTKDAIRKARENGHYVFLCTGRARSEIVGEVLELELDGMVCAAGGHIEIGEKLVFEQYIPLEDVRALTEFFDANDVAYNLESPAGLFASKGGKALFMEMIQRQMKAHQQTEEEIDEKHFSFMDQITEDSPLLREDINKVVFFSPKISYEEIEKALASRFVILPNSMSMSEVNSGELMIPGVHKASGIEKVLAHLELSREDTFAYGDGMNDLEMIEYAAYGIAMGNACEQLKAIANDITDSVDEEGIYKSFNKYGLI